MEALVCFEQITSSLEEGFINDLLRPFRNKIRLLLESQKINISEWENRIKLVPIAQRTSLSGTYKKIASRTKIRVY